MSDEDASKAWLYRVCPLNVAEATCGKALLLTDSMIAQVLDALKYAEPHTEVGKKALDSLWSKFMDLWLSPVSEPVIDKEELLDEV